MSQSVNSVNQIAQSGSYKWELRSIKKKVQRRPLDKLPLMQFPILIQDARYTVKLMGRWEGHQDAQCPDVFLAPEVRSSSYREIEAKDLTVSKLNWSEGSLKGEVKASLTLRVSNFSRVGARWDLLVGDQLVLREISWLRSPQFLIRRLWDSAVSQSLGKASWKLNFHPALKDECNRNTGLWQELVRSIAYWSEAETSRLARSIHSSNLARSILAEQRRGAPRAPFLISSAFPPLATNEQQRILGAIPARSQFSFAGLPPHLNSLPKIIGAQPLSASQIALPVISEFNASPVSFQGGKRKRTSLSASATAQKCQRTPHLASISAASTCPLESEGCISENEMREFLQENSLKVPEDESFYLTETEMQNFLRSNSVKVPPVRPDIPPAGESGSSEQVG